MSLGVQVYALSQSSKARKAIGPGYLESVRSFLRWTLLSRINVSVM